MPDDESIATSATLVEELREPCRATAIMSSPVKAAATPATTARDARADGRTANGAIPPTTVREDARRPLHCRHDTWGVFNPWRTRKGNRDSWLKHKLLT
jgi:hypothetical protein